MHQREKRRRLAGKSRAQDGLAFDIELPENPRSQNYGVLGLGGNVKTKVLIALSALWVSQTANAYFIAGSDLVGLLADYEKAGREERDADLYKAYQFNFYIYGVADALESAHIACFGPDVTRGQVTAVVAKWLRNNPERWNAPAAYLVRAALMYVFPCKK